MDKVALSAVIESFGGPGSGNMGHSGRPGEVGGSGEGGNQISDTRKMTGADFGAVGGKRIIANDPKEYKTKLGKKYGGTVIDIQDNSNGYSYYVLDNGHIVQTDSVFVGGARLGGTGGSLTSSGSHYRYTGFAVHLSRGLSNPD